MRSFMLSVLGISASTAAILGLVAYNSLNALETPIPSTPATTITQASPNQNIDHLAERVEDALESDRTLNQFDLEAEDRGNLIVLTGRVQTAEQKVLAEQIAQKIAPNVSITNQIVTL